MNEIQTGPGQDRSRGHASETGVESRPDTEPTPDHASGPGTSRTVEQSGAGRTPGDAWIFDLADKIGSAIEDGTADRYRRTHPDEETAFRAYARDHLNGGNA